MNSVYLVGSLIRKFQKRTVNVKDKATSVLSFSVRAQTGKQENYISCEAWGSLADRIDNMDIGTPVFVYGNLRSSSYEKNGVTVYKQDVNVRNAGALTSEGSAPKSAPAPTPEPEPVEVTEEIPF